MRTTRERRGVVDQLDPLLIDYDPNNPRGEKPADIEADPEFVRLRESVSQFGVMVPLVVMPSAEDSGRYVLIDGERRLRAALSVREETVPVRILPENSADALAQSFHIHSLRKQWTPYARLAAVGLLMRRMKDREPNITRRLPELRERVAELTGLSGQDLDRYVRTAVHYDDRDLIAARDSKLQISYFWEIEERFIDHLHERFPEVLRTLGARTARKVMLAKARRSLLGGTQGLRPLGKLIVESTEKVERDLLERLLLRFLEKEKMPATDVVVAFRREFPEGRDDVLQLSSQIQSQAESLRLLLKEIGPRLKDHRAMYPDDGRRLRKSIHDLEVSIRQTVSRENKQREGAGGQQRPQSSAHRVGTV
jgi:ParB/RepB/Spo0J family partition protein